MKIPFTKPTITGDELVYIKRAIDGSELAGDGMFSKNCCEWFERYIPGSKALLTPSCTSALEMAAMLIDVKPGDEVIMPSYTFVSTANAFVLRGAKIVFVDIKADTLNINEQLVEKAITNKTKAIVPVHYAGLSCDMDVIMEIAATYGLYVIEDAAQALMARYKGSPLGGIGHISAFSFHSTKNYTSGGEGGMLVVNDAALKRRAEVLREKGTNRTQFLKGEVEKYTWVDIGGSHLASELQAAFLFSQLRNADVINERRNKLWNKYFTRLSKLQISGKLKLLPNEPGSNAHIFLIILKSEKSRDGLRDYLKKNGIGATQHYVPLHSSSFGVKVSRFVGQDRYTTALSKKLLRLPLYDSLDMDSLELTCRVIDEYFEAS